MTDRINLTQLRGLSTTYRDRAQKDKTTWVITLPPTTVLALIDAAEAADDLLELYHAEKHGADGLCEACAYSALGLALDRFDHT